MGVSTDGILAFGVDLGERGEVDLPWLDSEEDDDFDSWYVGLHGVSSKHLWAAYEAWAETPEAQAIGGYSSERIKAYEAANPAWRDELNAFYKKSREIEKTAPIEIVYHCSGDYPMLIIAVPGTVTKAWRGDPKRIERFDVDPAKLTAAAEFCAEHGIPFENPAWLLASMWS